jgi:hypothetical protein
MIVLVLGLWMTIRSSNESREQSVVRLADMEATLREGGSAPGWAHAVAIGASLVIVLAYLRKS